MGNYLFRREVLERVLTEDGASETSRHDFGRDIIPRLRRARARACSSTTSRRTASPASPRARRRTGATSGRSTRTSRRTWSCARGCPRSTSTTGSGGSAARSATTRPRGSCAPARPSPPAEVDDSLVCEGSIISSATVFEIVLGYDCFVHAGAAGRATRSCCRAATSARDARHHRVHPRQELQDRAGLRDRRGSRGTTPSGSRSSPSRASSSCPRARSSRRRGRCVLANDVAELLEQRSRARARSSQPGTFVVSMQSRHSYESAGPRFRKYAGTSPSDDPLDAGRPRRQRGRAVRAVRRPRRRRSPACRRRSPTSTASTSRVVVPLYRGVDGQARRGRRRARRRRADHGRRSARTASSGALRRAQLGRRDARLRRPADALRSRRPLYGPGGAAEFPDNHVRFAALGKAAVEYGAALVGGPVDVLHVHDWQGAPRRDLRAARAGAPARSSRRSTTSPTAASSPSARCTSSACRGRCSTSTTSSSRIRCPCSRAGSRTPTR